MLPVEISAITIASCVIGYCIYKYFDLLINKSKRFNPKNKHCYITGGSQGLGLALAIKLSKAGAHVTIVARNKDTLASALKEIKNAAVSSTQKSCTVSADVGVPEQAISALSESTILIQTPPEYVFCCAGVSKPGFMDVLSNSDYERQMTVNYLGTVYTIKDSVRIMKKHGIKGKVVMTSSVAGLVAFIGYSAYSPSKFALRGFAEAICIELNQFDISTHCYFPGTIASPGLIEENKTKPAITKMIEGDSSITCEEAAQGLIDGLERDELMIGSDFIGHICRVACSGALSWNHLVFDSLLNLLSFIILPGLRTLVKLLMFYEKRQTKKKE